MTTPIVIIVCIFIAFALILYITFTVQRFKEEEPKELKEPKKIDKYLYSEKDFLSLLTSCKEFRQRYKQ